ADPDFTVQKKIDVGQIDADTSTISLSDESKHIYICAQDENTVFCVDLKKGKTTTCPDALTDLLLGITRASNTPGELIHFSPDGSMLAAQKEDDVLEIMSTDGSIHYTIEEETTSFLSASFTPDGKTLLTVDLSGYLRRYRAKDGQLLGRTDLYYSSLYNSTKIEWQFTERGFFTVKVDSVLNMIRYQDWEVFTYLTSSMGYLEEEDFFVCSIYAGDGENYSGFKRYSPQQLMDYAEELLNGWDLNDTQKTKYGLTD
ncbi:MAG: hypothetical protein IJI24_06090, partial [Lachnospiraceae bacterium]|nr:hypothetical protein [Lachnospiraceae bacterium]